MAASSRHLNKYTKDPGVKRVRVRGENVMYFGENGVIPTTYTMSVACLWHSVYPSLFIVSCSHCLSL